MDQFFTQLKLYLNLNWGGIDFPSLLKTITRTVTFNLTIFRIIRQRKEARYTNRKRYKYYRMILVTRSSRYFKSVTNIVANILTDIFYHYFYSYFTFTKGKVTVIVTVEVTHHNATMPVTLIKYRGNGRWD